MSSFQGRAEECAEAIIKSFAEGTAPAALARAFLLRGRAVPQDKWSWGNQLLAMIQGAGDARGFRQWLDVGRVVRKGEKGFPILAPIARKSKGRDDEGREVERVYVAGFRHAIVFDREQTDRLEGQQGTKAARELDLVIEAEKHAAQHIDSLPLIDLARAWGLNVTAFAGEATPVAGFFAPGRIALGVAGLSTWAHELMHAAEHRMGRLTEAGQDTAQEIVAQLGASVLLTLLGHGDAADTGYTWQYVQAYAKHAEIEPVTACLRLLKRTCEAVAYILDRAAAPVAEQAA